MHTIYRKIAAMLLLATALSVSASAQIAADTTLPEIVQSPYYDAIVLYYAFKGYGAYTVQSATPSLPQGKSAGPLPDAAAPQNNNVASPQGNNPPQGSITAPTFGNTNIASTAASVFANPTSSAPYYKIIESATGNVLMDNCPAANLVTVLANYPLAGMAQRTFIKSILVRNGRLQDTSDTYVQAVYDSNSYLKPDVDAFFGNHARAANISSNATAANMVENMLNTGGSAPSVPVPAAIQGLSEFYIAYINGEINDAFFITLQKELNKYPELQVIFPATVESLHKISITDYSISLHLLKKSFEQDMKNILGDIAQLPRLEKYRALINAHAPLTLLFAACGTADLINQKDNPADIFYRVGNAPYIRQTLPNDYSSCIKLASLISYCLRDIQGNTIDKSGAGWVSQLQLNALKNDSDIFRIFMGLFAQNADQIVFNNKGRVYDFRQLMFANSRPVLDGQYIVYNFSQSAARIKSDMSSFSSNPSAAPTAAFAISNEILSLADNCLAVLPGSTTADIRTDVIKIKKDYLPLAYLTYGIVKDITGKDYTTAIYQADTLVTDILTLAQQRTDSLGAAKVRQQDSLLQQRSAISKKGSADDKSRRQSLKSLAETASLQKDTLDLQYDSLSKAAEAFQHYSVFISSVAEAQNSKDVKNAIDAFALPKGSSRIKKEHTLTIGLNSFAGIYYSWNKQYPNVKVPASETGITAPLGIAFNWGWGKYGSLTLFGGVIDIGAIFSYQVNNSDSTVKSQIELGQILSPSVGLVYGFPIIKKYNVPLSIGFNTQWGPKLQKVSDAGNSVLPLLAQRTNVFIAFDIPIVNFYTSKKTVDNTK